MRNFKFKNGDLMPFIGIGTWQSDPEKLYEAIRAAVKYGYRHIDCAHIYSNEKTVGEALQSLLKEGVVCREELWITSKLWNSSHKREAALPAIKQTLADLQLDYLDLYLIHWPVALKEGVRFPQTPDDFYSLKEVPLDETWSAMEDCLNAGLTRHVGLSNFSKSKIEALKYKHSPEVNQIEFNPYLQQSELVEYCQNKGMCVTAFSPLGKGNIARHNDLNLFEEELIKSIARANNCTISQVLLAWAMAKDVVVIPKSVTPERIFENLNAANICLTTEEIAEIDKIDKENRISFGGVFIVDGAPYTIDGIWE